MVTIKKPQVTITQQFDLGVVDQPLRRPSLVIGNRFDVIDYPKNKTKGLIGQYSSFSPTPIEAEYPNRSALSIIDKDFVKVFAEQVELKYYDSQDEGSVWRKIGSFSNRLRTLLSSGLIFQNDSENLYPHTTIFKDRGVKIGDKITVSHGSKTTSTTVTGFVADKSAASVGAASAGDGNQVAQTGAVAAVVNGTGNTTNVTATANVGDNYDGSLLKDVISDSYTVRVTRQGVAPSTTVTNPSGTITATTNAIYNFSAAEIYTVEIVVGGAPGVATFKVTSASGIDNMPTAVTPAFAAPVALGSRGLTITFAGSGNFVTASQFIVSVTPSEGRLEIISDSGTDNVSNKVFPGFGTPIAVGANGVTISFAVNSLATMAFGDFWTISATKTLQKVVATSGGSFTGSLNTNYIVEVIQGGEFGEAVVKVLSTGSDGGQLINVAGAGSGNAFAVGSFGVTMFFTSNTQNGLIKGDIFKVSAVAAQDTAFKTIIVKDSIFTEADTATTGSATYTGSNGTPNTGASSGTYLAENSALDLNSQEIYTVTVNLGGAYGTATFTVSSLSGLDNVTTPTVIPVTPNTPVAVGTKGVLIAFTGANAFATTDSWTITVTKPNVNVKLSIKKDTLEINEFRDNDPTQNAWLAEDNQITVNTDILILEPEWDSVDALPIDNSIVYVHYRSLQTVGSNEVYSLRSSSEIAQFLGEDHIDNPVARATRFALDNSAGHSIKVIYPANSTVSAWTDTLSKLEIRSVSDVYRLAVISDNVDIINATKAHIEKMSTPEKNKWRVAYVSRTLPEVLDVVTGATGTIVKNGSSFNMLRTTNGNFETVKIGDSLSYLGSTYTVTEVRTATELLFSPDFGSVQSTPATVYIFRNPNSIDFTSLYEFYASSLNSRRMIHVVPDKFIGYDSLEHPGYFLCAAIAGLKAGNFAHQSLTNFNLTGVTRTDKTLTFFSEDQLEQIGSAGNFIVQQDTTTEAPYIRHQLTTNPSDLKLRELSITENLDDLSYGVLSIVQPFIGKYNLHTGVLNQISTNLEAFLFTKTQSVNDVAGPQILSYSVTELAAVEADRLKISMTLQLPAPVNYINVTITV